MHLSGLMVEKSKNCFILDMAGQPHFCTHKDAADPMSGISVECPGQTLAFSQCSLGFFQTAPGTLCNCRAQKGGRDSSECSLAVSRCPAKLPATCLDPFLDKDLALFKRKVNVDCSEAFDFSCTQISTYWSSRLQMIQTMTKLLFSSVNSQIILSFSPCKISFLL